MHPARRRIWQRRDLWISLGLFVLFVLGLAGLISTTGDVDVMALLGTVDGPKLALLLALSLVNYTFRGLRWHLFATRMGLGTSLMQNMRHFLGGFALTVTPARLGELVRMRWIYRETGVPLAGSAPMALMDRASDLAGNGILLALALALSTTGIAGGGIVAVLALVMAWVFTRPNLLATLTGWAYRLIGRGARFFARLRRAVRDLSRFSDWRIALPAMALSVAGWFAEGAAFGLLLGWMGSDIGLWTAVAIFVFSMLTGGATGAPGGLGGAEGAMIGLLLLQGMPFDQAVTATALIRLVSLWFAILVGFAVFPVANRLSRKGAYALENGDL
ncbi:flippase-like domain-containing protein [Rhodobacteraceae bacterium KN286]|uniref:Flippase-like domain-containing protein n=2 Tax=Oceanomicrobium pacificus TaxID=2692916 RepID=A0A6B0TU97_9RHOB|nr:flippase-like domain-containing protein [Oceanomicrobium pacificus]